MLSLCLSPPPLSLSLSTTGSFLSRSGSFLVFFVINDKVWLFVHEKVEHPLLPCLGSFFWGSRLESFLAVGLAHCTHICDNFSVIHLTREFQNLFFDVFSFFG